MYYISVNVLYKIKSLRVELSLTILLCNVSTLEEMHPFLFLFDMIYFAFHEHCETLHV